MSILGRVSARLRLLDAQYVPQAAVRTRAVADLLAVQGGVLAAGRDTVVRKVSEVDLRELDKTYASSGVLAAVREVPQLGFVVIAMVFLAGTGAAVVQQKAHDRKAAQQTTASPFGSGQPTDQPNPATVLGPDVGETTVDYVGNSQRGINRIAARTPDVTVLALVSFGDYRTPTEVQAMLAGVQVRRVYLRAKVGGKDAAQLPYDIQGDLIATLKTAYATVAKSRQAAHQSYLEYAATSTEDKAFHDMYASYAESTAREARAYQNGCACVFAAIVEGPARTLALLTNTPLVRAVQAANQGLSLRQLLVLPLLPEVNGIVPRGQTAPDPSH